MNDEQRAKAHRQAVEIATRAIVEITRQSGGDVVDVLTVTESVVLSVARAMRESVPEVVFVGTLHDRARNKLDKPENLLVKAMLPRSAA